MPAATEIDIEMIIDRAGESNLRLSARRGALSVALAAIIALVFLSQGITAPFTKDAEPQSAGWVRDVALHGHWLIARDDYGQIIRKPPLYYWLSAIVVKVSSGEVDEPNARIVSLIAGAALAAEVMAWSAAYLGPSQGWLAFLFLLGSYGFASRATEALTDMLLSFLLFTAYCILFPQVEGRGSTRRALAAGAVLGLAILTKGLVALVLCGLAIFLYALMMRRRPWAIGSYRWTWLTAIVAVAVAACWYVPALLTRGAEFSTIQMQENLGHFLPAGLGGTGESPQPFYRIGARMFGGSLPGSLLAVALAVAIIGGTLRAGAKKALLFQLGLVLAVLIFFSAASVRRDDYILPAMPGLAIAFASLFTLRSRASGRPDYAARIADWTAAIIAIAALAFVLAVLGDLQLLGRGAGFPPSNSSDAAYAAIALEGFERWRAPFVLFLVATAFGALVVMTGLYRRIPLWTGGGVAILALAGVALFAGTLRPQLARMRTLRGFAAQTRRQIGDAPLYVAGDINYELSFYYGRGVPALSNRPPMTNGRFYLAASLPALARVTPAVRERLKLVIRGDNVGGDGPLSLYEVAPPSR